MNSPYSARRGALQREGVRNYSDVYRNVVDRRNQPRRAAGASARGNLAEREMIGNIRRRFGLNANDRRSTNDLPNLSRRKPTAVSSSLVNNAVGGRTGDPGALTRGGPSVSAFDALGGGFSTPSGVVGGVTSAGSTPAGVAGVFGSSYGGSGYGGSGYGGSGWSGYDSTYYSGHSYYSSHPYSYGCYAIGVPFVGFAASCYSQAYSYGLSHCYPGAWGYSYWPHSYGRSYYGYGWRYRSYFRPALACVPYGFAYSWYGFGNSLYYGFDYGDSGDTHNYYFGENLAGPEDPNSEAIRKLDPSLPDSAEDLPAGQFCQGWRALRAGQFELASQAFQRASVELPGSAVVSLFSGLALTGSGEYTAAAARFEAAAEADPSIAALILDPARHFDHSDVYVALRAEVKGQTDVQPGNTSVWICRAALAQLVGDREDAARSSAEALLFSERSSYAREILRTLADRENAKAKPWVQAWMNSPSCETVSELRLDQELTR